MKIVQKLSELAHEFLLRHRLYKSHRTGKIIRDKYIDIGFPPGWRYNILTSLDYFRSISFNFDERMQDAIDLIKSYGKNGYWPQGKPMIHKKFNEFGKKRNEFNTLRALRVLKFYSYLN
jgi:hypothetical protein